MVAPMWAELSPHQHRPRGKAVTGYFHTFYRQLSATGGNLYYARRKIGVITDPHSLTTQPTQQTGTLSAAYQRRPARRIRKAEHKNQERFYRQFCERYSSQNIIAGGAIVNISIDNAGNQTVDGSDGAGVGTRRAVTP